MSPDERNAKERILHAAVELLDETDEPAAITVRQIADRAGVGVGSINYHFQSKEALLNEAVSTVLMSEAEKWFQADASGDGDPLTRLRMLLKETSRLAARYPKLLQLMISYGFQTGDLTVPIMILPLLREIFGTTRTELQLRALALQLVLPLQAASLQANAFKTFTGFDLYDDTQRDQLIDLLIDNLVR